MVLESVEVLVAFPARLALVGFVFFHAQGSREGFVGDGVQDAVGAVRVGEEGVGVVAVLWGVSLG